MVLIPLDVLDRLDDIYRVCPKAFSLLLITRERSFFIFF